MITAHNALSIRRRGSNDSGKKRSLSEFRDRQIDITCRRCQQLRAMSVAPRQPTVSPLIITDT
jgi:hypothetical protein